MTYRLAWGLLEYERRKENEKRIIDSGSLADDAGAGERAGRGPRVRDGGPSILWWFLPAVLGSVLGSCVRHPVLRISQRGRSQTGHQGEGRRGVHKWSLRRHDSRQ